MLNTRGSSAPALRVWLLALSAAAGLTAPAAAIISAGTTGQNGLWLNDFLGATRYYNAGYTGANAVLANIEGGHVWNGHETLTHVNTYINGAGVPNAPVPPFAANTPNYHYHSTWVGQAIAGRRLNTDAPNSGGDIVRSGIARDGTLWSGSVATAFGANGSFSSSFNSTVPVYTFMLRTGINGITADVSNSSWGSFTAGSTTNASLRILALDALAYDTAKVMVYSAGNRGSANTVGDPGLSKNGITVGALTGDTGPNPYSTLASYSSRGPSDFAVATGPLNFTIVPNAVASVDIVAPGDPIDLAYYGGASGGNTGGTNDLRNDLYNLGVAGTSFSSPMVAGGAGLIVGAARSQNLANGRDGRVVKALLMNSADKLPGWTNNTTNVAGVLRTTQAVDWAQGAGRMNLSRAYEQQNLGVQDLPGLGGGVVGDLGWDFGQVAQNTPNNYTFSNSLAAGFNFTATLVWFARESYNFTTQASSSVAFGAQDTLTLQLFRTSPAGDVLVAESVAPYNLNQHLSLSIPQDGNYFLRVNWAGGLYDFINKANSETYGLVWNVPAPSLTALLGLAGLAAARRRRA